MSGAYYNENDPKAAAWLLELIEGGHIPTGHVDQRSITEVLPSDLHEYTQCHFFAGIGGWPFALQLAGWPDDRPVWTGSCPCQPFSAAGKQLGDKDARHLWPAFFDLIKECRPVVVFGEQVANAIGKGWLDGISADLESEGYACGASVLGAHSVGAPHIRQRLWWVAYSDSRQRDGFAASEGREFDGAASRWIESDSQPERSSDAGRLALADGRDASAERLQRSREHGQQPEDGCACGLEHAPRNGREQRRAESSGAGSWSNYDFIPCADGKARRVESGTFPLAHGVSGRVGLLRGYGNAIVPELAAQFIVASLEALQMKDAA